MVDLQFDGLDFLSSRDWNSIPIGFTASFIGVKRRRGHDQRDYCGSSRPRAAQLQAHNSRGPARERLFERRDVIGTKLEVPGTGNAPCLLRTADAYDRPGHGGI
jgi:hypothetical protein